MTRNAVKGSLNYTVLISGGLIICTVGWFFGKSVFGWSSRNTEIPVRKDLTTWYSIDEVESGSMASSSVFPNDFVGYHKTLAGHLSHFDKKITTLNKILYELQHHISGATINCKEAAEHGVPPVVGTERSPEVVTPRRPRLGPGRNPEGPCTFSHATNKDADAPRVVVSISSMLGRVEYVMDTVRSVFQQSYGKPDMVYLSVPTTIHRLKGEVPSGGSFSLPENVTALEQVYAPYLKILHPPDHGAATKLLGAIPQESDPETIIVTLDDDVTYHQDTLACLVGAMKQLPPTFVACTVCEEYDRVSRTWRQFGDRPGACLGWLAAYAAAAYRRGFIAADWASDPAYNFTGAPRGCWVHDDVWLSGHMLRKGIRPYVVSREPWTVVRHRPYNKLSINRVERVQDIQQDCIDRFNGFL